MHIIDDDAESRTAIASALGGRFEVLGFAEPVDALVAIGTDKPDVVVLDTESTRIDGLRCIERLQALDATRHVRVVAYSGRQASRDATLEAGASAFVVRPGIEKLAETLDALLGTSR